MSPLKQVSRKFVQGRQGEDRGVLPCRGRGGTRGALPLPDLRKNTAVGRQGRRREAQGTGTRERMAPTGAAGAALRGRRRARTSRSGPSSPGGARGTRTPDLLIANETRYQLRHSPGYAEMVAPALPPPASRCPVTRPTYPDPGAGSRLRAPAVPGPAAVPGASQQEGGLGRASGALPYSPAARRRLRTASRSMGWNSRSSSSSSGGTGTWALTGRTGEATTSCSPVSRSSIMRRGARAASV